MRATELGGGIREGAEVTELTELYEVAGWPDDMRVICRRERPHPAQLSLFDTCAGWRHTCFITNTEGEDIAALELRHWGHARVEDRAHLEGLRTGQPALRGLLRQRGLAGAQLDRRRSAGLESDDMFRRCNGQGRAEDHALPGPPRRRRPRPPRA